MKIICKCGNCLTTNLSKVNHKEAYYHIVESVEKVYGEDGVSEQEYDYSQWAVKRSTYHKWKRKYWWHGFKNVYVVNPDDLAGAEIYEESQGCCQRDHFEVRCAKCGENVGYGADDCWTDTKAMIYARKVRINSQE